MTVYERIKNNKQWPMEIHSPLCDNAKLALCTNPLYPLEVTDKFNARLVILAKNGTYTETLGGECLISPIDVPSWENIYFPNVGDYITVDDGNKTTIVYVTKINPQYFNGYEIEINPGFKRINKVPYTYIAKEFKYNKASQKDIELFNSVLKRVNVEIKDGILCVITDDRPKSWEEYCKDPIKGGYLLSEGGSTASCTSKEIRPRSLESFFPTRELLEAMSAFRKLVILRQAWIKDWKPSDGEAYWSIVIDFYNTIQFTVSNYRNLYRNFSFPTKEMAKEFLEAFRDLFIKAKELL